jgi:pimeloyl-ACP methyl ester carboxylesterase
MSAAHRGLLLHGMAFSGEAMRALFDGLFGDGWMLVFPTFDGHHRADKTEFSTIGEQAMQVIQYLKEQDITDLDFIMGTSLGAQVAMRIMQSKRLNVKRYFFDGLPFTDGSLRDALLRQTMKRLIPFVLRHSFFDRFISRKFGQLAPHIKNFARFATQRDYDNIVSECFAFEPPDAQAFANENVTFIYGSREDAYRRFRRIMSARDDFNVQIKPGYGHCRYFCERTNEYVKLLI